MAEIGTFSVEFKYKYSSIIISSYLSRVTRNKKYKKAVQRIERQLKAVSNMHGLRMTYIQFSSNKPTGVYTMGALSDSYYEYLLKAWIQGGKKDKVCEVLKNMTV